MSYSVFDSVKIMGIAAAVPEIVVDNRKEASALHVDDIDKFVDSVGVQTRHVSITGQTSSDLCYVAASNLLNNLNIEKGSIDALIFVSQTPDYIQPSTAYVLHGRLGLKKEAIAFDINLGCSGFVYGLSVAASLISGMGLKRVLLLVGDIMRKNKAVDKKDILLFGDAGTATLLEKSPGKIESILYANGNGYTNLIIPGGGTRNPYKDGEDFWLLTKPEMDGESVMSFTITEVPKAFKKLFEYNGKTIDNYDVCLLHQANKQMVTYIAKKLRLPDNKFPISMGQYGNTNGASVLVTLADWCSKEEKKESLSVIASGYGIGLSWGVVTFDIETKNILPVITSNDFYQEAYRGKL